MYETNCVVCGKGTICHIGDLKLCANCKKVNDKNDDNPIIKTYKFTYIMDLRPSQEKKSIDEIEHILEYMIDNYNPNNEEDCSDTEIARRNTLRWIYSMFGHTQQIEFKNNSKED